MGIQVLMEPISSTCCNKGKFCLQREISYGTRGRIIYSDATPDGGVQS